MFEIWLLFSIVFLGVTAILVNREIRSTSGSKETLFGGTLNAYRYYKYLRNNGRELSVPFRLFLLAHINFLLSVMAFVLAALVRQRSSISEEFLILSPGLLNALCRAAISVSS
jgi:hypothetical protein